MSVYFLVLFFSRDVFCLAQNPLAIPDTLSGVNFNLAIYDTSKVFYPTFTTQTYGINGNFLAPTLFMRKGDSVDISLNNLLADTTTIHWHGMHVASFNDGGPHTVILPGALWNPKFKVRDNASTYWYHPHQHKKTDMQVGMGLAGLVIVRDSAEGSLNLPRRYGLDDFPLVVQSKHFDVAKQIVTGTVYDSVIMVNGTVNPFLQVPAQVIRLRILNGSSERVYNYGLQGNLTFYQIASDGGLLSSSVPLTRLLLAPGERAEILVDFTGMIGQNINLINFGSEIPNGIYGAGNPSAMMGSIPNYSSNSLNGTNTNIIQFQIGAQTINPVTTIPTSLVAVTPINSNSSMQSRTLTITPVTMNMNTMVNGPFQFNNTPFNMNVVNYTIPQNNIETWTINNQTAIAHPFHIHDVQFYILDINGNPPPANLQGRKDVVLVRAQQTIKFITVFDDFCDPVPYMYHCHMLMHEDDGLMGQFVVLCPSSTVEEELTAEEIMIYPNPSQGNFIVESPIGKLFIYNVLGKIIYSQKIISEKSKIDLSKQSKGFYFLKLNYGDKIIMRKIVIE